MRETNVRYRRPGGTEWEDLTLEQATEMIADRIIAARAETWEDADDDGQPLNRTLGMHFLGSPSIWTTFSSLTYTFCPQPTAQYGQMDCTTRSAVWVRGTSRSLRPDCAARPRPNGSPASWRRNGGTKRRASAIERFIPGHVAPQTATVGYRRVRWVSAPTCPRISRSTARWPSVTAALNDQRLERYDREHVQAIVTGAVGGERQLTVDDGGGLHDESGARIGAIRRTPSGEWITERQNDTAERSDAAIPAAAPESSCS